MCGILGYINLNKNESSVSIEKLKKSLDIIDYRGPDYSGYKVFQRNDQIDLFMGHNRLSIIDLSPAGNQPYSIGEDYHIIFNGEIYNYIEIKEDLQKKGIVFQSNSDTEVLLRLYMDSGTKRFKELNGMWSFIIYDRKKNIILASRDRFGVKPMYILEQNNEIFLASEIKQLLPFVKEKKVNEEVFANYLHSYLLDYNNETFFKNIAKLPASHNLILNLNDGSRKIEQFWDFSEHDFSAYSENEIVEEYKKLLESSVSIRLRSDVKVGNTLSGGLDSSSIAVLAHNLTKGNFFNYSIISNNKEVSEEKYVDYLIQQNKLNVTKINFDDFDPWEISKKVIWHHDEPILSLSTIAHYKMLEVLKKESDIIVVLSGQGGDESLAGYNKYFFFNIKDLISQGKYGQATNEIFKLMPRMGSEFKWNFAKRYISIFDKINAKKPVLQNIVKLPKGSSLIGSSSSLKSRQILDIKNFSVPPLCHYEDRNSMAHSLEIRLPFLDYRLVNYSVNLPNKFKIKNGINKQILRQSMHELPAEIRYRFDKKGFTVDEKKHQTQQFNNLFKSTFQNSALADLGFIDVDLLKKEFELMKINKSKLWERDLHRIIFSEMWAKNNF